MGSELPDHRPFDELHVISDLHIGGEPPASRSWARGILLAGFIRQVVDRRPAEATSRLVLDGDIVDTLAEDVPGYIAIETAVATIERIIDRDPAFSPVWAALADFVRTKNRTLVLVIGNHDLELALPPVQRASRRPTGRRRPAARGRIEFSTYGAGSMPGRWHPRVLHPRQRRGRLELVRYEDLARVSRRLNAGRPVGPSEWEPNAGTKMVKDVMNEVKRRYAWIDLLKPETQARRRARGARAVPGQPHHERAASRRRTSARGRRLRGAPLLRQLRDAPDHHQPRGHGRSAPRPHLSGGLRGSIRAIQHRCGRHAAGGGAESAGAPGGWAPGRRESLGAPLLVWDRLTGWMTGVGKDEALRRALLDWLAGDKTFDLEVRDPTFQEVTKGVGPDIGITVTGHTHLARALPRSRGRGAYFNSGTWVRLIHLTERMLESPQSFQPVYDTFRKGTLAALDAHQELVLRRSKSSPSGASPAPSTASCGRPHATGRP